MSSTGPRSRKVTRVAVGVLIRADGCVLLADRPVGKPYAGYWEFPGGKIEQGEPVALALERELHEELGIEIGPSVPWVTFEFDYPHAFVQLQFRRVRHWRDEPHAREGQRLRFVDPAGALPQPLLPAAVPALRWLRLPSAVLLFAAEQSSATTSIAASLCREVADRPLQILVVEQDWRVEGTTAIPARRPGVGAGGTLLFAAGPGARRADSADGIVLEVGQLDDSGVEPGRWQGAWVDSEEDLRIAASRRCDFVVVRSAGLADRLRTSPAALPAFLPAAGPAQAAQTASVVGHGCWFDLRPSVPVDRGTASN